MYFDGWFHPNWLAHYKMPCLSNVPGTIIHGAFQFEIQAENA